MAVSGLRGRLSVQSNFTPVKVFPGTSLLELVLSLVAVLVNVMVRMSFVMIKRADELREALSTPVPDPKNSMDNAKAGDTGKRIIPIVRMNPSPRFLGIENFGNGVVESMAHFLYLKKIGTFLSFRVFFV